MREIPAGLLFLSLCQQGSINGPPCAEALTQSVKRLPRNESEAMEGIRKRIGRRHLAMSPSRHVAMWKSIGVEKGNGSAKIEQYRGLVVCCPALNSLH